SGHFVRFLFAPQRSATPLGAQTGKSLFRSHSRTTTASPLYRFNDSEQPSLHAQRKAAEGCRTPQSWRTFELAFKFAKRSGARWRFGTHMRDACATQAL